MQGGQQLQFTAVVQGTGYFNNAVTWSVNGIAGGNATNGSISSSGDYTAPTTVPTTNPVAITATSVEDTTKSGSASLAIFTLTISPPAATVVYPDTEQFTATVVGIQNPVLLWTAISGTVSQTGLFTPNAPNSASATGSVTVSIENVSESGATAPVTVQFPPPTITAITPNSASAWQPITIAGEGFVYAQQVLFNGPFGSGIAATFQLNSPDQITAYVPTGTVSGPVTVTAQQGSSGPTITSNRFNFTRMPNVRIRTSTKDLSSGEQLQFTSTLLGVTSTNSLTWTTDLGSVTNNGLYTAPTVTQESYATVSACLQGALSCDKTLLRILPLRITPATPVVAMGQTLQLQAVEGSQISANWSIESGGGSVTSGLFTAPTTAAQTGGVQVLATAGPASDVTSVGVTGGFPGLISRTYDYINYGNVQTGTKVQSVATSGTRAFALDIGAYGLPQFNGYPPYTALETYDISNPAGPVWLGASESISSGPFLFDSYSHYLYEVDTAPLSNPTPLPQSRIALYDVQNNSPQLVDFLNTPDLSSAYDNNGVIYATALTIPSSATTVPIYVFDTTSGTIGQREIDIPLIPNAAPGQVPLVAIGNGSILYALFATQSAPLLIAAFDTSASPPTLLGTTPVTAPLPGLRALIRGNVMFLGHLIYDISSSVPVQIGTLPLQVVLDAQSSTVLGAGFLPLDTAQDNFVLVDISDLASPVIQTSLYETNANASSTARLIENGNGIIANDYSGGIEVFDLSSPGGLIAKAKLGLFEGVLTDPAVVGQTMYLAGESGTGSGGMFVVDLSSGTAALEGQLLYQANVFAVQVSNTNAFVGTADSLKTVDISNPSSPLETASMNLPTNALALSGSTLFDGTADGRLVALNISNPNSPTSIGAVQLPAPAVALRLVGSTMLIPEGSTGMSVFDVSNPGAPVQLSQISFNTPIWDVALDGSLALVAADSTGLVILDVSDPTKPTQLSQTTLESYAPFGGQPRSTAESVAVNNSVVYVGTANAEGLVFGFDYSQPSYPRLVSMNAFGDFTEALVSGLAFVGYDVYVLGYLGDNNLFQCNTSTADNVINLYSPPLALRGAGLRQKAQWIR